MAARSTWKGFLKLSLVSVPVKAYTAAVTGSGEIRLNQLHAACHSRIKYQKTCPIHGEVSNDEIVSGYEYVKGQYVIVDPDELDKLRSESDKAISLDTFISQDELDPMYYERTYYLVPDGPVGQKPYRVLHRAMVDEGQYAVGQVVISGREQLVLLRPMDGLLALTVLKYADELKKPAAFSDEAPDVEVTDDELKLAKMLVAALKRDDFDFSQYKDAYIDNLTKLIHLKVEGKEIVAPPAEAAAEVINLMDALRESVARAQGDAKVKPPKKMAASRTKSLAKGKKKTG